MSVQIAEMFRRVSHGVYIIGVAGPDRCNAFTAAWVMQVSFKPLMLALSVNLGHSSYGLLKQSGRFSVNVLGQDQFDLALHFGQPSSVDKLAGQPWHAGTCGIPLIDSAIAQFECVLTDECTAGDHRVVVGKVIGGQMLRPDDAPMLYRAPGTVDGAAMFFPGAFEEDV